MSNLSDEVQNELHAKGLLPFVSEIRTSHQIESSPSTAAGVGKSSPQAEVELIVYENEKWHNILQEFGSVLNVHLNAVFDRAPLTDESGFKTIK